MLYVAKRGFATMHKGERVQVQRGAVAEEGHWILQVAAGEFKPVEVTYPAPAPKSQSSKSRQRD